MKKLNVKTGLVFFLILSITIVGLSKFFLPKNSEFYYKEDNHYDVVFFGTSESFTSFDPAIFDEFGIDSYNRARRNQPIYYTYYAVLDAIDACDVDTVVVETHDMISWLTPKEDNLPVEVIDSSLNNMRFSKYKFQLIKNCLPDDMRWHYYIALDKYHGRWEEFANYSLDEWKDLFTSNCYTEARGYQSWNNIEPLAGGYPSVEFRNSDFTYELGEAQLNALEGIYEACSEKGVNLVLVKSVYPCNEQEIGATNELTKWANERGIHYVNFMNLYEEIGIVEEEDDSDGGNHLNLNGARKESEYLAKYLIENNLY